MALSAGVRLGPYEILSPLGAGGMGEVYRARDTRLGREVAVKVLPPEFAADADRLRRFEQEARAVAALDHPNILVLHDLGTHEGTPYMVTELLEGESLRQRLKGGAMAPARAAELGVQIAFGLAAAHEKGIVHRDLKPDNLFVTRDGRAKILDFGLARLRPERAPRTTVDSETSTADDPTQEGRVLGTPGYMSPEQIRGTPADARSDIFSYGCVLYEMLCGRRPFPGESAPDVMAAVLKEDPAPYARAVAPPLDAVVRRCLEKRPSDRFQSAREAGFALQACCGRNGSPDLRLLTLAVPARKFYLAMTAAAAAFGAAAFLWLVFGGSWARGLPSTHPRRVTNLPGASSEPALSPGGTEVAYTRTESGDADIWVTDVRGGTPLRLTSRAAKDFLPTWFPDGTTLAFVSDEGGTLSVWTVPRFGGTPMLVVPDATDPAISPGGDRLAFARPGPDGFKRIWTAPLSDVSQARRITGDGDGLFDHGYPAWSPDGHTLCYTAQRGLWCVPAAGGQAHPFTRDDQADQDPCWAPDGRHIYFSSYRDGTLAIWRQALRGGSPERVTLGTGPETTPSLSRDGRVMAYTTFSDRAGLTLIDRDTGQRSILRDAPLLLEPALAPDGGALVYVSDKVGTYDLWKQPLRGGRPDGPPQRLTALAGTCVHPSVSPDGRWIVFFRNLSGRREVWIIPSGGGTPRRLSGEGTVNVQPEWSPDGRRIAFVSDRGGAQQLWVAPVADGAPAGEPRRIATPDGSVTSPSWSADGARIAFLLDSGNERGVWIAEVSEAKPPRKIAEDTDPLVLVWDRSSGKLLVSGFFGKADRGIWEVSPDGGAPIPFTAASPSGPDKEVFDIDVSADGKLIALQEWDSRGDIWVLECVKGRF